MADDAAPAERCPFPHGPGPEGGREPAGAGDGEAAPVCPVRGAAWDEATRRGAAEAGRRAAAASRLEADRAGEMAVRAAESRAERRGVSEIDGAFVGALRRKLGYGHPLSERTGELSFTWTPQAEARLEEVPAFCRELTRWRVEWTAHKLGLGPTITPETMDRKYEMWAEVSHRIQSRGASLPWTDAALDRFSRVPDIVRGQVLEAVEGTARRLGAAAVDDAVIDSVIARWVETGDFHEGVFGFR